MEKLFERHDEYLNIVPMDFIRNFMYTIKKGSENPLCFCKKSKKILRAVTGMSCIARRIPAIFLPTH